MVQPVKCLLESDSSTHVKRTRLGGTHLYPRLGKAETGGYLGFERPADPAKLIDSRFTERP